MNALLCPQEKAVNTFLMPTNYEQAWQIAEMLSQTEMVPKQYIGRPADTLVAMAMGAELGFQPLQSLQNIAVINGRPSVWGDAFRALIVGSPDLVEIKEWYDDESQTAHCVICRQLASGTIAEFHGSFGVHDAQTAKLWGKAGPWTQYPKRQQQWRALGFAGRDAYADRLRGIWIEAEAADLPPQTKASPKDVTPTSAILNAVEQATSQAPREADDKDSAAINRFQQLAQKIADAQTPEEMNKVKQDIVAADDMGELSQGEKAQIDKAYKNAVERIKAATVSKTQSS